MKYNLLNLIIVFFSLNVFGQNVEKFESMPYDSIEKKIEFNKIILLEGNTKNEILGGIDYLKNKINTGGDFNTKTSLKNSEYYSPILMIDLQTNFLPQTNDSLIIRSYELRIRQKNLTNVRDALAIMTLLIKNNRVKLIFSDFTSETFSSLAIMQNKSQNNNDNIRKNKKGLTIVNAYLGISNMMSEMLISNLSKKKQSF